MEFSDGRLVDATLNLLKLLSREVAANWPLETKDSLSTLLSETLSNLMKVVMNLTHDSNDECKLCYKVHFSSFHLNPMFVSYFSRWKQSLWRQIAYVGSNFGLPFTHVFVSTRRQIFRYHDSGKLFALFTNPRWFSNDIFFQIDRPWVF